ncbi:MAG: hypothetical protein AAFR77_04700 [Cyanobacteria bacterium J06631_2]
MNDWQDEWWKQIEKTAIEIEAFFTEVGETTELLVDEVSENVGSFFDQFQAGFGEEVEDFIHNFVDVIVTTSDDIEAALFDDWDNFVDDDFTSVSYHTPSAQSNPACIDCANYHGHAYNGNLLVCAMHPQGMDDSSCPDWSQK